MPPPRPPEMQVSRTALPEPRRAAAGAAGVPGLYVGAQAGVGDDVVAHERPRRRQAPGAGEDDALAVAVDDVALDERPLRVGVELDAAVDVVVDDVVEDAHVVGGGDVDAMVLVGRRAPATVVDA